MKKAMLFSGGYDSTYLLNKLMKTEEELTIVCIKSNMLSPYKVSREEIARKRILDYLTAKYYNCKVTILDAEININGGCNNYGLAQPLMWLPFMCVALTDDTELNLSYICDDQATIHMQDFQKIIEISSHFQNNKNITVDFPLRYLYKRDIISSLVREDKFLFENATSCEGWKEEKDFCGKCVPCKCLRSTLIDLICDDEVTEADKEYYKKFLKDKFDTTVSYCNESNDKENECNTVKCVDKKKRECINDEE